MTSLAQRTDAALGPLRAVLLAAARAESDAVQASCTAECLELAESARRQADAVLKEARARGTEDGALRLATDRARIQREARQVLLAAQRTAYDDLRQSAKTAIRELMQDPVERARLAEALRLRLGSGVVIHEHADGGLVGESTDGRVVDASVETLVDAALSNVDLQSLWSPA